MDKNRRDFLKQASMAAGAAGIMHFLPASVARAMAIDPATGSSYLDAEHVVFLMQENRSFDHTFGSLQGVRGFNDPRVVTQPDGLPVWLQKNQAGETFAPFRLDIHNTKATWMGSLPHSWPDQVDARNEGRYDQWIISKASGTKEYKPMPLTMGYHTREDIPFYYALADAFTVCDQHFSSSLTGTTPNRLFFWTGTIRHKEDEEALARVYNADADYGNTVNWKTFPERLEEAGISWKVYQNEISAGVGLDEDAEPWLANFTDNPLEFFDQFNVKFSPAYINNLPAARVKLEEAIRKQEDLVNTLSGGSTEKQEASAILHELRKQWNVVIADQQTYTSARFNTLPEAVKNLHHRAFTTNSNDPHYHELTSFTYNDDDTQREVKIPRGDVLHQFRTDVNTGQLPAVSWLVAPENFSDHPDSAWYGAWYISEVMDILTKDPAVWKKTIFILTYDENDGYFDHIPPFVAPHPYKSESGFCSDGIGTAMDYVIGESQQSDKERVRQSPVGLGYRVPMVIASPWTRGGWVNSELFDHTSSLQFLEKFLSHRTGKSIVEKNISKWRRTICGDLTSAFRPYNNEKIAYPKAINKKSFISSIHEAQFREEPSDFNKLSTDSLLQIVKDNSPGNKIPEQERGTRPSNALPYEQHADLILNREPNKLMLALKVARPAWNLSTGGSPFYVYSHELYKGKDHSVRNYAVAAGDKLTDQWNLPDFNNGRYDLRVNGPNGFFRRFCGTTNRMPLELEASYHRDKNDQPYIVFQIRNLSGSDLELLITDKSYGRKSETIRLKQGATHTHSSSLGRQSGWYDLSVTIAADPAFEARYAGRVETGKPGITDPFMGRVV